ncbi:MAG: sodium:solute symporter family protein [Puniceicoccaceae bacterium]|nr:sodium:solute symporter family protein [Puniceicoccaceae bacterium]
MTSYILWAFTFLVLYLLWLVYLTVKSWISKSGTLHDYFLAGNDVGFIPSLLTFWATYFSAAALIGASGYYYIHGIGNFLFASLGYCILALVTGTVGVRLWKLSRKYPTTRSPIQLYLRSYNSPRLENLFVFISLLCLVPYMAAQITGFARLLEGAIGLPYLATAAGALIIIFLYSESGGLKNIVRTDVLQSLMTIIGCIGLVIAFLWIYWDFDFKRFFKDVDALYDPSLMGIPGPKHFYTPTIIISLAVLISLGAIPMAHNAQRYMIVRELSYLRRIMFLFPAMGIFVTLVAMVLGLGGAVHFPGLESGDQVIGRVTAAVPAAIGALATVGIVASTMSTADSILLSIGFIVSEQKYRNNHTHNHNQIRTLNRWCILTVTVFSFVASIQPSLVTEFAFNAFGGMLQLAPVMIAGIYEMRIAKHWAFVSALSGLSIVVLGNTPLYGYLPFNEVPHYFVGFIIALTVLTLGRICTRGTNLVD